MSSNNGMVHSVKIEICWLYTSARCSGKSLNRYIYRSIRRKFCKFIGVGHFLKHCMFVLYTVAITYKLYFSVSHWNSHIDYGALLSFLSCTCTRRSSKSR